MPTTPTPVPSRSPEERAKPPLPQRVGRLGRAAGTRIGRGVLALVVLLVAARVAAPFVVEEYLNRRLAALEGYTGHVEDVDLALIRGAYQIEGMKIRKTDGAAPVAFFSAREIDLSVEWGALLDGKVVAEIDLRRPVLNFVLEGDEAQTGAEVDWAALVDDLVPITVNRLAVQDGEVHYRAYDRRPEVDVFADRVSVVAYDLSTERRPGAPLPSRAHMDARVQRSGELVADARIDPSAADPSFDLSIRLRELPAREINSFLRAYAGVDAETGRIFVYSQVRARDGRFNGYVKPMAEQLSVFQFGEDGGFIDQVGDFFAEIVLEIFENHGNDTVAVDVPIAGSFERPEVGTWAVVVSALKNAFVEALEHGLDDRSGWRTIGEEELRTGRAPEGERQQARAEERAEREERAAERAEEREEREEERAEQREEQLEEERERRRG